MTYLRDMSAEDLRYEIGALQHVLNDKYHLFREARAAGEYTASIGTDITVLRIKIRNRQTHLLKQVTDDDHHPSGVYSFEEYIKLPEEAFNGD